MLLEKIRIDGFRNIVDTTIDFNEYISAILGFNNYGKTNLLTGIEFAKNFIDNSPKTKTRMMNDSNMVPINNLTADKDFSFGMEFISSETGESVKYSFSFEWVKNEEQGARIKEESLSIKEKNSSKYKNYIKRNFENGYYRTTLSGRVDNKIEVKKNELILNKLREHEDIIYAKILKEILNAKFEVNSFFGIDAALKGIAITNGNDVDFKYTFDRENGADIARVIYNIQKNCPDKYQLLINSLQSLIPTIEKFEPVCIDFKEHFMASFEAELEEKIPFKVPEKYYDIRVKEKYNNQSTSVQSLSSGTKRIIVLLTSVIIADLENVKLMLLEELENSIHPYLFQNLLIILSEIASNCRILISSHSPYLVRYLDLENIYVAVPSNSGLAKFRKVKKSMRRSLYRNAEVSDMNVGDYLFDLLIESVEDQSDICHYIDCD
ncbi:AAA family ATPase [Azotosporobacter soli]|uniref:AAA family ATPase n=1 Tax=Azotosporobacter soli TaxID=3055040 RepID=UPI0031FE4EF0